MNDNDYGKSALSTLMVDPRPHSKVDLGRAVRDGRKARRRRRLGAAAVAVVAVAATTVGGTTLVRTVSHPRPAPATEPAPADPTLPTSCTTAALPVGTAKAVSIVGGDPTGHWYAGTENPMAARTTGVLVWHDGKLVTELAGRKEIRVAAVNSSGVAVAWDEMHPVYLRNGVEVTMKGSPQPTAINSSGVVVGEAGLLDTTKAYAARWSSPNAAPERLPDIDGRRAEGAYLVTDDGLVIGNSVDRSALMLWYADGRTRSVPVPAGSPMFHPAAFRNGWIYVSNIGGSASRYSPATGTWQQLGQAGGALVVPSTFMSSKPQIFVGRQPFKLPLPPGLSEEAAFSITAMSDNARHFAGYTLSSLSDRTFPSGAFIWTCR